MGPYPSSLAYRLVSCWGSLVLFLGGTVSVSHYLWEAQVLSILCEALIMTCAHGETRHGTGLGGVCDGPGMDPTWAAPTAD